jgi:hypothetical protein
MTDETMVELELLYETVDEIVGLFPDVVSILVFGIPEGAGEKDDLDSIVPEDTGRKDEWRNKWLYLGASAVWTPRIYVGKDNSSTYLGSFGAGLSAELHFLNFMSFETGVKLASDWVATSQNAAGYYQDLLLEIPLLIKFVLKPGTYFMIEPYVGAQLNIPFFNITRPPLISLLAGLQYGVEAGPGALFIDGRFAMDFGYSTVGDPGRNAFYHRYIIHLGLGYKFGLFQKK